jgi:hypothetical protein
MAAGDLNMCRTDVDVYITVNKGGIVNGLTSTFRLLLTCWIDVAPLHAVSSASANVEICCHPVTGPLQEKKMSEKGFDISRYQHLVLTRDRYKRYLAAQSKAADDGHTAEQMGKQKLA